MQTRYEMFSLVLGCVSASLIALALSSSPAYAQSGEVRCQGACNVTSTCIVKSLACSPPRPNCRCAQMTLCECL